MPALDEDLAQREQDGRLVVDQKDRAHARASTMAARAAGSGDVAEALGSVIVAVVPRPTPLVYLSWPPCWTITPVASTTPRPVPFGRVVKNDVPSRSRSSGAIPRPVSVTASVTCAPSRSRSHTEPPCGGDLKA